MRFWLLVAVALGITACASPPAPKPETSGMGDLLACFAADLKDDYESAIALCSRALQSGELSQRNTDDALNDRGFAYMGKGEYDRAIQDFEEAIRLTPDSATAYSNRGAALLWKGENDRAMRDYDQAIRLKPDDANNYISRGNGYQILGSFERAIQDYDQAIQMKSATASASFAKGRALFNLGRFRDAVGALKISVDANPTDAEGALWLAMARKRAGENADDGLRASAQGLDFGNWPGPIVRLYLGQISRKAVIEAAADPEPSKALHQSCEAEFHVAEMDLVSFQTEAAKAGFRHILDICPKASVAAQEAKVELGRM